MAEMISVTALQDKITTQSLVHKMLGGKFKNECEAAFKTQNFHTEFVRAVNDSCVCASLNALLKRIAEIKLSNFAYVSSLSNITSGHTLNASDIAKETMLDRTFIVDLQLKVINKTDSDYRAYSQALEYQAQNIVGLREDRDYATLATTDNWFITQSGNKRAATVAHLAIPYNNSIVGIKLVLANIATVVAYTQSKKVSIASLNNVPADISNELACTKSTEKIKEEVSVEGVYDLLTNWEAAVYEKQITIANITTTLQEFDSTVKLATARLMSNYIPPILGVLRYHSDLNALGAAAELLGVTPKDVSSTKNLLAEEGGFAALERLLQDIMLVNSNPRSPISMQKDSDVWDYLKNQYPTIMGIYLKSRS